jgi:lambda repressor-like predicted transcriptional regulator
VSSPALGAAKSSTRDPINLDVLDRERRARGWTWTRLAKEADIDGNTLKSVLDSGTATPRTFVKLASAFERHEPSRYGAELAS